MGNTTENKADELDLTPQIVVTLDTLEHGPKPDQESPHARTVTTLVTMGGPLLTHF